MNLKKEDLDKIVNRVNELSDVIEMAYKERRIDIVDSCINELSLIELWDEKTIKEIVCLNLQ